MLNRLCPANRFFRFRLFWLWGLEAYSQVSSFTAVGSGRFSSGTSHPVVPVRWLSLAFFRFYLFHSYRFFRFTESSGLALIGDGELLKGIFILVGFQGNHYRSSPPGSSGWADSPESLPLYFHCTNRFVWLTVFSVTACDDAASSSGSLAHRASSCYYLFHCFRLELLGSLAITHYLIDWHPRFFACFVPIGL